jgi:hypothetical protein
MAKAVPFPMTGRSSGYAQGSKLIWKGENAGADFSEGWVFPYRSVTDEEILSEIHELKRQVNDLQSQLQKALACLQPRTEEEEMITLRDVPLADAKKEIAFYFREHDGKNIGYDELISKLQIEPLKVVQACAELEEEGKIG